MASLRIARRQAWGHKGRSALVIVMIALPIAVVVFGDVAYRTLRLEPEQQVARQLGTAADAFVGEPSGRMVVQAPPGSNGGWSSGRPISGPKPTIDELVPEATDTLLTHFRYGGGFVAPMVANDRRTYPAIRELDYTDPLAAGLVEQVSGRAPADTSEVVVTESLADTLAVAIDDPVTLKDVPYTLVGTVLLPGGTDWEEVIGQVGAFEQVKFAALFNSTDQIGSGWLVEQSGGLEYTQWKAINAQGSAVISRAVAADPPASCSPEVPGAVRACRTEVSGTDTKYLAEVGALIALIVGMGLLQVVLLVGPAFAIGRRSQAHDLALVAAVGGDARAVRRVVLASGLFLGLVGGALGLVIGVLAFQLLRPVVSHLAGTVLFSTDVNLELLIVVVIAMLTGLVAAWLPARQASKQDVIAALAGRRGVTVTKTWMPTAGLAAIVVGTTIAFYGAVPGQAATLLLGCAVAELGLVALAPSIVGWISKLSPRLPTAPRLALRDAGRNRLRAGTAVSAVLAAVAGACALGIWVASDSANAEQHHTPIVPVGYVGLTIDRGEWPGAGLDGVAAALPTDEVVPMTAVGERSCIFGRCDQWRMVQQQDPCAESMTAAGACGFSFGSVWSAWMTGDASTYRALTGTDASVAIASALDDGGVVVAGDRAESYVSGGQVEVRNHSTGEVVTLPAALAPDAVSGEHARFELLLSEPALQTLDLPTRDLGATLVTTRPPTSGEVAAARGAIVDQVPLSRVDVGRPFEPNTALPLLLLLGGAVVLAIAATATAVGLAGADARPDLATLAAIGASPRTRRWLSASQAGVVSVLGTLLGLVGGVIIGVAAISATVDNFSAQYGGSPTLPLTIPWSALAMMGVVVPTVAVTLAFVFSRSRLVMVRRLD